MSAILWCGGEDVDFNHGTSPSISTGTSEFQWQGNSGFAREALGLVNANNFCWSNSFPGGSVTSFWLHALCFAQNLGSGYVGITLNSAGNGAGLYVGPNGSTYLQTALYKWDGTTWTQLTAETGQSLPQGLCMIDINVQNFGGGSPVVDVYVNGTRVIHYTTAITITGVTAFDAAALGQRSGGGNTLWCSEFIVTDTMDTRALRVVTLKPNAAGTTNNWDSGNYSNINPTSINDTSLCAVNSTGKDMQYKQQGLPTGSFYPLAVKMIARAQLTAGSTPTTLKLGVNSGGTISVDSGHSLSASWTEYENLMTQNPVSAANWSTSDLASTGVQGDLQSA